MKCWDEREFERECEHERDFFCLIVIMRVNFLLECEIDRDRVQTVHEA